MKRARSPSDSPASASSSLSGEQRINKLLAAAGLGSRREVDELIEQGRVEINGVVCDQLGMKVDADTAKITVDGTALKKFRPVYYALNKPAGVLCTNRDPQGRRRAIDFIPGHQRLFPVGRLDAASTGLLLLTNDGELTQQLTHPKHGVPKTYLVVVAGQMSTDEIRRLRRGIYLSDGFARIDNVEIRKVRKNSTELEIKLSEGKNREIRRVLAKVGHKVVTLRRTSIGPLKLANLPEAAYRPLTKEEIAELYRAADDARKARKLRKKEDEARKRDDTVSNSNRDKTRGSDGDEKQTLKGRKIAGAGSPSHGGSLPNPNRDPFAWDDDEELLKASPFASDRRLSSSNESGDDEAGWDSEIEDAKDQEDESSMSGDIPGDTILVNDRGGARSGKVLDYDDRRSRTKSTKRPTKTPALRENRRPSKKSVQREPRSFDQTRGRKKRPGTGTKKFSGAKSSKKAGFKKAGFKKGGTKKGALKRGGRAGRGKRR